MESEKDKAKRELLELFDKPIQNFGGLFIWVILIILIFKSC